MANAFAAYLSEHHTDLDDYLLSFFTGKTEHADLERYLYAPLRTFTENGGKRHRPLICLAACKAVGGDPARARSAAAAIEHFQSAALIHDDIADHGQLRRGKPCLYLTEGTGLAINCGDLDLTLVTDAVLNDPALDNATRVRVLRELTAMTERTIEGQALDLGWVRDGRFDLTIEDYLRMATLKTAHYSGAVPLACGAIIGGGSEEQIAALRSFGLDTGLAFQIQDDLINIVGSDHAKDWRTDITEGKRTLVAVRALADERFHDELETILSSGTSASADLDRAVWIFQQTGAIEFARSYAADLTARAKQALAGIELDAESRALFLDMADFFIERLS